MSRVYFREELEGVAMIWRIDRRDGVSLGFTSHDRALWLGGLEYRAAPGMLPTAIARRADLSPDSAEIEAVLSHDAIAAADLDSGRFDGARVMVGIVDWETGEHASLYHGSIGGTASEGGRFTAELRSAKHDLLADTVPRTSPTCRAQFCGPGCGLSAARFTHEATIAMVDAAAAAIGLSGALDLGLLRDGALRWIDGADAGLWASVIAVDGDTLVFDRLPVPPPAIGDRVILREGCDHTLATCAARFANAVNFRGEPFLPGNDQLIRRPVTSA